MATEEGWHTVEDGHKLYTKTWKTEGPAKARVVFIHGFSDHSNTYVSLFPVLAASGIEVYAFDQRGWGRSVTKASEKGLTGPTSRVLDDMTSFIKSVTPSPVPLFLVGHSMGGGETLHYAARGPAEVRKHIRGYVLIAPYVGTSPETAPAAITVVLGRLLGKLLPNKQMHVGIKHELVCRDEGVQTRLKADELCHDTGTLQGLSGMLDRTSQLSKGEVKIGDDAGEGGVTRIWIGHGDKDGVTDFKATKRFYETCISAKDKELRAYSGYYHRLQDEPEADRVIFERDVVDWILARSVEPVQEAEGGKSKL